MSGVQAVEGQTAEVVVRGVRLPIVATSLEYTTIDLTGCPEAGLGDEVTLMGGEAGISIEDWAGCFGVSPLEMLCSIGGRMPSVVVE